EQRTIAVAALASAIGPDGMTGGQQRDLFPLGTDLADIEITHAMKTGALFAAAAEIGCIVAGVSGPHKWMLSDFGMLLGKAFQEFDDLLDKCADLPSLGKDTDQDANTPTIVDLLGHEKAERRALRQIGMAFECLDASAANGAELRRYVLDLTRLMRAQIARTEIQPMNQ
ncbi:MAG: polyprenyl synthetase family protein, partial [Hyphomicrobiaceae bacterium]